MNLLVPALAAVLWAAAHAGTTPRREPLDIERIREGVRDGSIDPRRLLLDADALRLTPSPGDPGPAPVDLNLNPQSALPTRARGVRAPS